LSSGDACGGTVPCANPVNNEEIRHNARARQSFPGNERSEMIEHIVLEKCTGCGICDRVCPADVIHMEPAPLAAEVPGLRSTRMLPVIKFREHCITCFSCEIFCPEGIVDVHPSVKNRPRPW
jgi:NAD-dependent dihydropyrimidine dehydrogenase PreA subunit